ncbi:enoyl-CoA hydratase/isomerase-like protein [Luteibacter rhizovicinus]|uniref:3-hydroxyisobutyryl-CoA hydrolase n=1 Tax=Luteibacter rhizovicinus TaxID=242606 RepID=A0A4R3YR26_9GAMM|nr:enoyl-CoA hydratase/isomerase family protein [Luteibacter rhizovicinus]TCV94822.1 enoyl-CoA hydratase/isomerase-like protein [Luteibacter rhizovicinus]
MNDVAASAVVEVPVLFEERVTANGRRIGVATLNVPKTLNGLSLDMARLLDARLEAWAADDRVAMIVLQGAGEKAFCAGGDLHGLYHSMVEYRASGHADIRENDYARDFFATEYRLDYRIHTFPKPVLCWGHGIVMGGGIGLMAGASHRVVTERSRLAMPEITVGLYPDVGGSWLLDRVPGHAGLFLALTGAPLNASDAIYAGLADHYVQEVHFRSIHDGLSEIAWGDDANANAALLTSLLRLHSEAAVEGPLQRHSALIDEVCGGDDLDRIVAAIAAIGIDDPWLDMAKQTLAAGAPGSARLAFELRRRARGMSLADVFRMEYVVSLHCAARGDFAEGIRALLIDKDRTPRWQPMTLGEATVGWADGFFVAPWREGEHPLARVGTGTDTDRRSRV